MPSWGSQDVSGYGDSTEGDFRYEGEDQTSANKNNGQQIMQGISNGLAAGAANSINPDEFSVDPNAGFIASNQAFGGSGGKGGGAIAGAITAGVTAQMGQFSNVNKKLKGLNTSVNGVTYDAYGRPVYNSSNIVNAQNNIDALNRGYNSMTQSALFDGGEGIDPATRGFAALYGTPKKILRKRAQLEAGIQNAQMKYNQSDIDFRNQQNQMQDYYRRQNPYGRMYNLNRARFNG